MRFDVRGVRGPGGPGAHTVLEPKIATVTHTHIYTLQTLHFSPFIRIFCGFRSFALAIAEHDGAAATAHESERLAKRKPNNYKHIGF